MTLSKITLSAAALAAAAVITVPFVTRAQNPTQKSNAASSPVSQPPLVSGSGQAVPASTPALLALNTLRLSGPFKLHYSVVVTDVRTPEMKANTLKLIERSYADQVRFGDMTQAAADEGMRRERQIAADQASRPHIQQFDVTIASDGSKLFYQKIELEVEGQETIIYDGSKTFDYNAGFIYALNVDAGLKFYKMFSYPIPGVAVPHVALLQESAETPTSRGLFVKGDVPTMDTGGAGLHKAGVEYQRGEIALTNDAGKTRISAMTGFFRDRNYPNERWEFSKGQLFQGVMIASKIRLTYYESPDILLSEETHYQKPFLPARVTEYRLISADTSLSPSQFDPAAYLSPGDRVQDNTSAPPRAYSWHPGLKLD